MSQKNHEENFRTLKRSEWEGWIFFMESRIYLPRTATHCHLTRKGLMKNDKDREENRVRNREEMRCGPQASPQLRKCQYIAYCLQSRPGFVSETCNQNQSWVKSQQARMELHVLFDSLRLNWKGM